jgi:hypothetical protein
MRVRARVSPRRLGHRRDERFVPFGFVAAQLVVEVGGDDRGIACARLGDGVQQGQAIATARDSHHDRPAQHFELV